MAGMYPDPLSWRLPYDVDGTQFHVFDSLGHYRWEMTPTNMREMNSEYGYTKFEANGVQSYWILIFPELRDIDGYYVYGYGNDPYAVSAQGISYSSDTTNGLDGTWTFPTTGYGNSSKVTSRTGVQALGALGVRAFRFKTSSNNYSGDFWLRLHLYGERSAGSTGKFLYCWHPTLDQRVPYTYFEYGDVPRTQTTDKLFRVKNDSSFTANNVIVTVEAILEDTPSIAGQFAVSTDGISFTAQVNIGNLSPGAISAPLTIRQSIASNAALGLYWPRLKMQAGSWT